MTGENEKPDGGAEAGGPAQALPLGPDGACEPRRLLLNEVYRLRNGSLWRWNGRELVQARRD